MSDHTTHPVAHPLPEGVHDNFTYACNDCGGTVTVISSTRQPHTCTRTERDELARIIMSPESFDGGPASSGPNDVYAARTADAVLAAGWRKPRTITTAEELDALPVDSVVLSGGRVPRIKAPDNRWLGEIVDVDSEHIIKWTDYATVLHEPETAK